MFFKRKIQTGNDYRVASLSISYSFCFAYKYNIILFKGTVCQN